jgi:hypothetical protein
VQNIIIGTGAGALEWNFPGISYIDHKLFRTKPTIIDTNLITKSMTKSRRRRLSNLSRFAGLSRTIIQHETRFSYSLRGRDNLRFDLVFINFY